VTIPSLDGPERVLDRFAPLAHSVRVGIEPLLYSLEHMLVLPSGSPPLPSSGALRFERAARARRRPVAPQLFSILLVRVSVLEAPTGRATIDVLIGQIDEVLLPEAALRLGAPGSSAWQRHRDAGLVTLQDLRAVEVAAIGNSFEGVGSHNDFRGFADACQLGAVRC
jgi:hypothetical protein